MQIQKQVLVFLAAAATALSACAPNASQLRATIEKDPDILFNAIEKNPDKFMAVMSKVEMAARSKASENQAKEEEERFNRELANPVQAEIASDRAAKGKSDAPITIVEYTDFQCPYCGRGFETMKQVLNAYPGKIRLIYKSLPLPFHPMARPAAQRFEAIALQDVSKAWKFHDEVFGNQDKLSGGEKYLDSVVKKVGADLAKVKKDMTSEKVSSRIASDTAEAGKFGITGTPGFLVAGVSVRGAYPFETFKKIIDKKLGN